MTKNEHNQPWKALLDSYEEPEASAGFLKTLENHCVETVASHQRSNSLRRSISALATLAALILIFVYTPTAKETGEAWAFKPLLTVRMQSDIARENADEIRFTLMQLMAEAEQIVTGRFVATATGTGVDFEVERIIKGDLSFLKSDFASNRKKEEYVCPAPPTFASGRWAVLFVVGGEIFTDQWKAEFDRREDYEKFVRRVLAYWTGTVLPTLLDELENGEGDGPYAERDRIFEDALAIAKLMKKSSEFEGLLKVVRGNYESNRTMGELSLIGEKEKAALLTRLRLESHFPFYVRRSAIAESTGSKSASVPDDVLDVLGDDTRHFDLRLAAVVASEKTKDQRSISQLIQIWDNLKDQDTTPIPISSPDAPTDTKARFLRVSAIQAIGKIGGQDAARFLLRVLRDDADVSSSRGHAARGLMWLGEKRHITDLESAIADNATSTSSRQMIKVALEALEHR